MHGFQFLNADIKEILFRLWVSWFGKRINCFWKNKKELMCSFLTKLRKFLPILTVKLDLFFCFLLRYNEKLTPESLSEFFQVV